MHLSSAQTLFVALLVSTGTSFALDPPTNDALQSLVAAEKNFAQTSLEKGTREAFLANLAEDGIVFEPGPVKGKAVYAKREPSDDQLSWEPMFADVAQAGDLGYTTGPWEYKKNKSDDKPAAYGQFFSIWKKQPGGNWKVALDGGIGHSAPVNKPSPSEISPNELATHEPVEIKTARRTLAAAEKEFDAAAAKDASAGVIDASDPNIHVLRNGRFPATGRDAARLMIGYDHGKMTAKRLGGGISRSGDLAYSYGEYTNERLDGTERGYFITVWRMSMGGDWKLAVDVRKGKPPAAKKD